MKKLMTLLLLCALVPAAFAAQEEEDRVKDSGQVLSEILNIPDNKAGMARLNYFSNVFIKIDPIHYFHWSLL